MVLLTTLTYLCTMMLASPLLVPRGFHHGRYWEKDKKQIGP